MDRVGGAAGEERSCGAASAGRGLALSPDGESLVYSESDRHENQILVMKNFH